MNSIKSMLVVLGGLNDKYMYTELPNTLRQVYV